MPGGSAATAVPDVADMAEAAMTAAPPISNSRRDASALSPLPF